VWFSIDGVIMKKLFKDPVLLLMFTIVTVALTVFVIYPLINVFIFPEAADYAEVFSDLRYRKAAWNSFMIMILSTLTATVFGFIYAYSIVKTDIPGKKFFRVISILPLFSPPFMVAFSYLMLFGKNGLITYGLFGVRASILGWHGLWLAQTIAFFPVASMSIEGVLRSISPSVEYAGRNLGADGFNLFRRVTLPLSTPGIAGAALLVSILVLADFGNPIMISGDFSVLATEAWMRVEGWGDVAGAAVISIILLIPSVLIFLFQRFWVKRRSYVTITGKIVNIKQKPTVWWAKILFFLFCSVIALMIILVYLGILLGAVVKGWGYDWTITTQWITEVLVRGKELVNSLVYSVLAGTISATLAIVAAYLVSRNRGLITKYIDFSAILPAALPGIFIGIGYSVTFTSGVVDLYGTAVIVILAMIFWNISMGYQTGLNAFKQISVSLSEAALNMGANQFTTFWKIEAPLVKSSFVSAFIVSFIRSITTLSVIVFLATSSNKVATFTIMNFISDGFFGKAAALTTFLLIIAFLVLLAGRKIAGKNIQLFD
jgi:iron(III) transport system permease protein